MKFGVMMFTTDYSMTPMELAIATEDRDFESLWFPEHSHIPLSRKSQWPAGGDLPKMYYDVMDPFVGLAGRCNQLPLYLSHISRVGAEMAQSGSRW